MSLKSFLSSSLFKYAGMECVGLLVYVVFTPFFVDVIFKDFDVPLFSFITFKWVMSVPLVAAISFGLKYKIGKRFVFRREDDD